MRVPFGSHRQMPIEIGFSNGLQLAEHLDVSQLSRHFTLSFALKPQALGQGNLSEQCFDLLAGGTRWQATSTPTPPPDEPLRLFRPRNRATASDSPDIRTGFAAP